MIGVLLRFARNIVQNVLGQLVQQINIVQQQALSPMQKIVEQVVGGIWVGKGADAFVEEVQSLMMPRTNRISETINIFHRNVQNAIDVMDRADKQANQLVNGLADTFGAIF